MCNPYTTSYCKFLAQLIGKRILKIGLQLPKLWAKDCTHDFFDSQCILKYTFLFVQMNRVTFVVLIFILQLLSGGSLIKIYIHLYRLNQKKYTPSKIVIILDWN